MNPNATAECRRWLAWFEDRGMSVSRVAFLLTLDVGTVRRWHLTGSWNAVAQLRMLAAILTMASGLLEGLRTDDADAFAERVTSLRIRGLLPDELDRATLRLARARVH